MSHRMLKGKELETLTGYSRATSQARALKQMGIPHFIRPDGWPVVNETDLSREKARSVEPDFSALDSGQ